MDYYGDKHTMEIIIPAAGASSRFPDMRPKYLLTCYDGKLMIEKSMQHYLNKYPIHIGILKEHDLKYNVTEIFSEIFGKSVNVVIIDKLTRGPAETVYEILNKIDIGNSSILIKDCDSFFEHTDDLDNENAVYVDNLASNLLVRQPANKSYVTVNDQMIVNNIIEKKIVSEWFCVGGYQFKSATQYQHTYEAMSFFASKEIYVSTIIDHMINNNNVFSARVVKNWIDVGTKEDWLKYNNRPTIFMDIDGSLVENQMPFGKNNYSSPFVPLEKTVALLQKALKNGSQIIFTTARNNSYQVQTRKLLDTLGFKDCMLIMGLHHSPRILVNDYSNTNPYPSATAINLARDSDTLDKMLRFD